MFSVSPWFVLAIVALWLIFPARVHAAECGAEYTVQPGDSLWRIARKCGRSVYDLAALNQLADPNRIRIGQVLALTGGHLTPNVPQKGLAMALPQYAGDVDVVRAEWYYQWTWCNAARCVPMVRSMESPPACPPVLLVGNEPNAIEPWGAPFTPEEAVNRVLAIERQCPQTRLVIGNVSADDWSGAGGWGNGADWLRVFLAGYYWATDGRPLTHAVGVHCYTLSDPAYCIKQLGQLRALFPGEMWVTEFGVVNCTPARLRRLLTYISANFAHYSAYTNRQPHTGQLWEAPPSVELVNADGSLSVCGRAYAEW